MSFSIRVIQPSSLLSIAAVTLFSAEVKSVLETDAAVVLVDFSNITSMSSSSFIALVKALQSVRASKRQLFLCSVSEQLRMLFELTGLDQVFKIFTSFDEFDRYMQSHGNVVEVPHHAKHNLVQRDSLKLAS